MEAAKMRVLWLGVAFRRHDSGTCLTSIEAGDHIIASSFAICTVVKTGIRKRPGIDVETVNEVEH